MNYKTITIILFLIIGLLFSLLLMPGIDHLWTLAVFFILAPLIVIVQMVVVLKAKEPEDVEFTDGSYEH